MTFKEQVEATKNKIKSLIKADTPDEQIEALTGVIGDLDGLNTSHDQVVANYGALKDKYIASITNTGTAQKPEEEQKADTPKSLEEIAAEVVANRGKK